VHNSINVRGTILNEILMTLSNLVDYEDPQPKNINDLSLISDETVYIIWIYLKCLWKDSSQYDIQGTVKSLFASSFQNIVSESLSEKKTATYREFKLNYMMAEQPAEESFNSNHNSPVISTIQTNDWTPISSHNPISKTDPVIYESEIYADIITMISGMTPSVVSSKLELSHIIK
jgi:hypothetical protein